jgi:hypothetical protein
MRQQTRFFQESIRRKRLVACSLVATALTAAATTLFVVHEAHAACQTPVAVADSAETFGQPVVVDVLANDYDLDGDELNLTVLSGHSCTGDSVTTEGSLIRVVHANQAPRDCLISYRITDTDGHSSTSQLHLVPNFLPLFSDGFETGNISRWAVGP